MNRPEPGGPTRSSPDRSPQRNRKLPQEGREDIANSLFGVIAPLPRSLPFPSLARRGAALLLDLLISLPIPLAALLLTRVVSGMGLNKVDTAIRFVTLCLLLYGFWFAWWESSSVRATPGKILLDLRVATKSDQPLSFADAMIRFWLKVGTMLTLNAGMLLAWRDPRGRALHDRLCGSVVIAQHLLPGQLRTACRPPRRKDLGAALVASALAYGLVFQLAPAMLSQFALADRFDAAINAVRPALMDGELVDADGFWSRHLREASEEVRELQLALDIDSDHRALTLRLPPGVMVADAGRFALESPSVVLERGSIAAGDETWSCIRRGLATYAAPRQCAELASPRTDFRSALDAPPGTR